MNEIPAFVMFSSVHVISLVTVVALVFAIPYWLMRIRPITNNYIGKIIALILITNEIMGLLVSVYVYGNPLSLSLPFHLCDVAALLTAGMLWRQSYRCYEVAYFWGIGGSIPALLTPDLMVDFPHPSFLQFFFGHGLIMLGALYATFVYEFRPSLSSVAKAILATLLLMLAVAPINLLLNANYMYLNAKPAQATLMNYFGPWPWYVITLILIGTIIFYICYLPFKFLPKRSIKNEFSRS